MSSQELLRLHGLRVTQSRTALLDVLAKHHSPQSMQELLERLPKGTDRVTVYRSLEQFIALNLVRPVYLGGSTRYERRDDTHDHHHIVCTRCHTTQDIDACAMKKLNEDIIRQATRFARITDHSFEVFGLCKTCAKTETSRDEKKHKTN